MKTNKKLESGKRYINIFLAALADLANTWNEPADEEQGFGNTPVVLVVYDDGSGFVGDGLGVHKLKGINIAEMEHITIQGEFDNLNQAFEYLDKWLPKEKDVETFR